MSRINSRFPYSIYVRFRHEFIGVGFGVLKALLHGSLSKYPLTSVTLVRAAGGTEKAKASAP